MAQDEFRGGRSHGERTGSTQEQARNKAGQMAEQAQHKASEVADQAKEQVTSQIDSQKDRAAESLGSMSKALRRTSSNLREENESRMAEFVEQAASQVDRFTSYLNNRSGRDLFNEIENIARREPGLFFGGAMLLGLAAARFFKSSSPDRSYGYRREYGSGYPYGRPTYGTSNRSPYDSTMEARQYPFPRAEEPMGSRPWSQSESSRFTDEGSTLRETRTTREERDVRMNPTTTSFSERDRDRSGGRRNE